MSRYLIEHLPRSCAKYVVTPLDYGQMKSWLGESGFTSVVRTTELISAIETDSGLTLAQSHDLVALRSGDEALLVTLSFGVLLACAQGKIQPLPEDWRCLLLRVAPTDDSSGMSIRELALAADLPLEEVL